MPIVTIDMWPGRTVEQKEALVRNVRRAVVASIGCPEDAVRVVLHEVYKPLGEQSSAGSLESGTDR
ncbi:MAG: tautomerase family protein [Actinobacteria bacterium]|nr:tautomerase family protein [Actinomycetota bacterium]